MYAHRWWDKGEGEREKNAPKRGRKSGSAFCKDVTRHGRDQTESGGKEESGGGKKRFVKTRGRNGRGVERGYWTEKG